MPRAATESLTSASVGPVANVNDAPVLTANSLSIGQGGDPDPVGGPTSSASDVDNAASTLTFTVSNVANGRFELSGVPGVGITSFTQADVAGGVVVFVHDGSAIAPELRGNGERRLAGGWAALRRASASCPAR